MKRWLLMASVGLLMITALTPVSAKVEPITESVTAVEHVTSMPLMEVLVSGPTLLGTQQRGHQVVLSWSAVSGATGFEIHRGPTESELVWLANSIETLWTDASVIIGETYVYQVTPYSESEGIRTYFETTNTISITVVTEYDFQAPKQLHAFYEYGVAYLSWNSDWKVESYTIQRKLASESTYTTLATIPASLDNTYEDSTVLEGSKYLYIITANKTGASGEALTQASAPIALGAKEGLYVPEVVTHGAILGHYLTIDTFIPYLQYVSIYRSTSPDGPYTFIERRYGTDGIATASYSVAWGTTTYYKIVGHYRFVDLDYVSDFSDPIMITTSADLENVWVWDSGIGSEIMWDSNHGASVYEVLVSRDGIDYVTIGYSDTTSYRHENLTLGERYFYKVRTVFYVNSKRYTGDFCDPIENIAAPPYQYLLADYINRTTVKLEWEDFDTFQVDGYLLYQTNNGADYTLVAEYDASTQEATRSGLSSTLLTGFKLVAYVDVNGVRYTSDLQVDPVIPWLNAPNLRMGVTTSSGIAIHWDAVGGADAYVIYRITNGNLFEVIELTRVTTLNYFDRQVEDGGYYEYIVVPIVMFGSIEVEGLPSEKVAGYAQPVVINPYEIDVVSTNSTLKVSWIAIPGVSGYEIQRSIGSDKNYGTPITLTSATYTHTGLGINVTVYYRIRAFYLIDGVKIYTDYVYASGTTHLATPTLTAKTVNPNTIALSWNAITGATSYTIYVKTPDSYFYTALKTVTTTSFTHTGTLYAQYEYKYYVVANGSYGATSNSSGIAEAYATLAMPLGLKGSSTYNSITLTYGAVAQAEGYEVVLITYTADTYSFKVVYEGSDLSTTITDLHPNSEYLFVVTPYYYKNGYQYYGYTSDAISIKTKMSIPKLSGTVTSQSSVKLNWTAVPEATSYNLYKLNLNSGFYEFVLETTDLSATITGLSVGVPATFRVRANRQTELGQVISGYSVTTLTPALTAPSGLHWTSIDYNTLTLAFTGNLDATGYEVYRATTSTGTYTKIATVTSTEAVLSALTFNTTYFYKVRAYLTYEGGTTYSAYSSVISGKTALTAVTNPSALSTGYDRINVQWNAVSGATGYEVWRSTGTSTTYALVKTQTTVGFLNTALVTNTTYNFKIRAYRLVGTTKVYGAFSTVMSAKPIPAAPIVSVVSGGTNALKVSWPAVAGANGYEVSYSSTEDGTYTLLPLQTAITVTINGLTVDTPYYVKVRSYRLVGTLKVYSDYSGVVSAKPLPLTPTLTGSSGGFDRVNLSWTAIAGASGYELYRLDGDTYTLIADQTGLSFIDDELITGTTRSYKVVAYAILSDVKIRSLDSTIINVTPIPSIATNLKASFIDYNLLSLDWDDVLGATGYEVSYATTSTGAASVIADVSVSDYTRSGLTFNTTGYYRVRAYTTVSDVKVYGNWTTAVAIKTALTAVSNPSAAYTAYNAIQINWSAVNGATGYEVWRSTGTSTYYTLVKTQTTVGFLNTALLTNTKYNYKIRAYRLVGTVKVYGAYSSVVSSVPLPWAPTPTASSAAYNALKISWPAVAGANGYEVSYATSEAGPFTVLPTTTLTSATITNLLTNSTYTVRVRAYRIVSYKKVFGAYSDFVTGTPIPATPAPKVVSGGFDSLNLSWLAIAGATGYDVQWLNPNTSTYETLVDTTTLSTVHSGLVSGVAQSYKVFAYRLVGDTKVYSTASDIITGTPIPATALGLKLSATNVSTLDFTWTPVLGASGYEVARSTTATGVYTTLGTTETAAYQVTGLTFNTTSYIKVRAYTLVNDVKVYGTWTTAVLGKTLPGTPVITLSSPSYTSIQVDWASVSGVTGYEIWRSTGTSTTYTLIKTQTTVGFLNTGLVFNTRYNYKIRAYKLVGTTKVYGAYSTITSQTTQVSAPSVLNESTFDSITLNWAAVSGANGYDVAIATSENGPFTVSLQTTLTKTFSGLTTGSTYYVKVRSYRLISTTKVYGPYSTVIAVTPSLQVPTLQISGMTSTSITVSWDSVPGATDYEVRIRQNDPEADWFIEEVSELTVTFSDLDPSAFYSIQIRSLTKDTVSPVYSTFSEELTFSYSETS